MLTVADETACSMEQRSDLPAFKGGRRLVVTHAWTRPCLTLWTALFSTVFWSWQAVAQAPPSDEPIPDAAPLNATGDSASETEGRPPDSAAPVSPAAMAADNLPATAVQEAPETPSEPPEIEGRRLIFYRELDYGSESIFNPATVVISVGLGFYGLLGEDPLVQRIGSGGALHRLAEAYAHPIDAMRGRGSVGNFLSQEIVGAVLIPVSPNLYLHMLGEGMVTRKLEEYYLAHGLTRAASVTLAIATMTLSQQLNELTEQQSTMRVQVREGVSRRQIDGADSLADGLFWNILGMVAFQFDGFAELFDSRYLNLAFWPRPSAVPEDDSAGRGHTDMGGRPSRRGPAPRHLPRRLQRQPPLRPWPRRRALGKALGGERKNRGTAWLESAECEAAVPIHAHAGRWRWSRRGASWPLGTMTPPPTVSAGA